MKILPLKVVKNWISKMKFLEFETEIKRLKDDNT